jgi:hypothetical protein
MRKYVKCCQCGAELVGTTTEPDSKQSLCLACWRSTPSEVIVSRSHDHEKHGHSECTFGRRVVSAGEVERREKSQDARIGYPGASQMMAWQRDYK